MKVREKIDYLAKDCSCCGHVLLFEQIGKDAGGSDKKGIESLDCEVVAVKRKGRYITIVF